MMNRHHEAGALSAFRRMTAWDTHDYAVDPEGHTWGDDVHAVRESIERVEVAERDRHTSEQEWGM